MVPPKELSLRAGTQKPNIATYALIVTYGAQLQGRIYRTHLLRSG